MTEAKKVGEGHHRHSADTQRLLRLRVNPGGVFRFFHQPGVDFPTAQPVPRRGILPRMKAVRWGGGALLFFLLWGAGCSGSEADGSSGDGDGDGDSPGDGDGDGDGDSPGDGDGDSPGDGDGDGDGDAPIPTFSGCEAGADDLPPRDGAIIHVSPAGAGLVTVDGSETTLRSVLSGAAEGDTILLAEGTYTFDEAGTDSYTGLYITTPNVTLRGETGDASDVILDSNYADHGMQTALISVDAPGVVLADLTVKRSIFHLVHLWENGDDAILFNVTLEDGGQQFVKASPGEGIVDGVEVACSRFLMSDEGRDNVWGYGDSDGGTTCYTGGIDTHDSTNWWVHDNHFEGIYCDTEGGRPAHGKKASDRDDQTYAGGLAEHAVHMWNSASGTGHIIERNRVVDCARGIGIGLAETVYGTIIRNNVLSSSFPASGEHDVAITVERGVDTSVLFNTVYYGNADAYPNSIEIRWGETDNVTVHGNFTSGSLGLRDGATAVETDNVTEADPTDFRDPGAGDFRAASCESASLAAPHPDVTDDFEGAARSETPTVGAYECAE